MKPAYHIPLSKAALSTLGEICVIQGQIEWIMQRTISLLLDLSGNVAGAVLGSTSIRTNADTWIKIVRQKFRDHPRALAEAEKAYSRVEALTVGRNDFVHAFYAREVTHYFQRPDGSMTPLHGIVYGPRAHRQIGRIVAIRTKGGKRTSIRKLRAVKYIAAAISRRVAMVEELAHDFRAKQQAEQIPSRDIWQLQRFPRRSRAGSRSGKTRKRRRAPSLP